MLLTKEALYERGEKLVSDALFVRDQFIPAAQRAGRWNITVFESYRVIELAVKSVHLLSGYLPQQTHEIDELVANLCKYLSAEKRPLPFLYTLFFPNGDCFGLRIFANQVGVYRRASGVYWQLGNYHVERLAFDRIVRMSLQVHNRVWQLLDERDKVLLQATDETLDASSPLLRRTLVRVPNHKRVERLQAVGQELRSARERSFYQTQAYSETDARTAVSLMEQALQALAAFFVVDRGPETSDSPRC